MPVSTPCIRICVIDDRSGLCTGCGRTLAEIGGWSAMGEEQRRAIMATLDARLTAFREPAAVAPATGRD